jgi:hypothetical protein
MCSGLQLQCQLFLSDFNETNFLDSFSKNTQISNFVKICSVGAVLFNAKDGQTDTTKLIVAFRNIYKHV